MQACLEHSKLETMVYRAISIQSVDSIRIVTNIVPNHRTNLKQQKVVLIEIAYRIIHELPDNYMIGLGQRCHFGGYAYSIQRTSRCGILIISSWHFQDQMLRQDKRILAMDLLKFSQSHYFFSSADKNSLMIFSTTFRLGSSCKDIVSMAIPGLYKLRIVCL